jgi:acetyl-CoA carboxylase biotin carboxylase subunit/propionyl-CoA carboxylase alpha chain
MKRKIKKVLVANRGVPAVRVMHTCRDRKIRTVAVYSAPDRIAHHVYMADEAVYIGEAPPQESYLNIENIIDAALKSGSNAVHPGWGFLAENSEFAQAVMDAGLIWLGPDPSIIYDMGDKIRSKELARKAHVPTIPGINNVTSEDDILEWLEKEKVEYPIMLKPSAGGGGKGMIKISGPKELKSGLERARSEAMKSFGDSTLLAEKYVEQGRHIEVQIVADKMGNIAHLYDRECTLQRRNQKIIEEAPSATLDYHLRQEICYTAVRLMREIQYTYAGTVEFLYDCKTGNYYFLEVNTRLQVEHGTTELSTGKDIVGIMLDVAEDIPLPFKQEDITTNRHAIEVRLNAEDPITFSPSFGQISRLISPDGPAVRVATGVYEGALIPPFYDSNIMLIMTTGASREGAIRVMDRTLSRNLRVEGIKTNAQLLLSIIRHPSFMAGEFSTRFIETNLDELVSAFRETNAEDEVLKIARFVAEVSALGPRDWM